jgi:hypothetical protein
MKERLLNVFSLVFLISLLIFAYISQFSLPFFESDIMLVIVCFIIFVGNIICVIILFKKNPDNLFKYVVGLKLGLIPYWGINLFNFILITFLGIVGSVFVPLAFIFLPGFWIFKTYITLLCTSFPSILFLIHLKKNNLISLPMFVLHLLLQICFFGDIISTIILLIRYKIIMDYNKKK